MNNILILALILTCGGRSIRLNRVPVVAGIEKGMEELIQTIARMFAAEA